MTDVRAVVVELLAARGPLPDAPALDAFDYIDSGHVDSLALMKFIVALENAFDIELTDADIESERFRVVGGLVALIEERLVGRPLPKRAAS